MSITRLTGGITPGDGSDPRTFPAIFNDAADTVESQGSAIVGFEAKNIPAFGTAVPSDGDALVFNDAEGVYEPGPGGGLPSNAYAFVETIYFTSNGTFTKADYPWLRAIRVKCQGAGGGGGGVATTTSNQTANGNGGRGGTYAESFITNIAGLGASVSITVGAGGAGGAAGNNAGATGGNSSFGTAVIGNGGGGGIGGPATGNQNVFGTEELTTGGTGDLLVPGQATRRHLVALGGSFEEFRSHAGGGGGSLFGTGGLGRTNNGNGASGSGKGSGGSSGLNAQNQSTARTGGDGAAGLVIVELYA